MTLIHVISIHTHISCDITSLGMAKGMTAVLSSGTQELENELERSRQKVFFYEAQLRKVVDWLCFCVFVFFSLSESGYLLSGLLELF